MKSPIYYNKLTNINSQLTISILYHYDTRIEKLSSNEIVWNINWFCIINKLLTGHDEAITFYSKPFCVPAGNKQVLSHEGLPLLLITWYRISSQHKTHRGSTAEIPEEQWKGYYITPTFHSRNQEKWPRSKHYKVTRNAWLQTFQTVFLLMTYVVMGSY
jgi:hypothetical protein